MSAWIDSLDLANAERTHQDWRLPMALLNLSQGLYSQLVAENGTDAAYRIEAASALIVVERRRIDAQTGEPSGRISASYLGGGAHLPAAINRIAAFLRYGEQNPTLLRYAEGHLRELWKADRR